jgi:hypothetical protein
MSGNEDSFLTRRAIAKILIMNKIGWPDPILEGDGDDQGKI